MARKGGNNVAATCATATARTTSGSSTDPASRTHHANIEATCATCHGNEAIIKQANLPGGNVASDVPRQHPRPGDRKKRGEGAVPTCISCHGSHDIHAKSR